MRCLFTFHVIVIFTLWQDFFFFTLSIFTLQHEFYFTFVWIKYIFHLIFFTLYMIVTLKIYFPHYDRITFEYFSYYDIIFMLTRTLSYHSKIFSHYIVMFSPNVNFHTNLSCHVRIFCFVFRINMKQVVLCHENSVLL